MQDLIDEKTTPSYKKDMLVGIAHTAMYSVREDTARIQLTFSWDLKVVIQMLAAGLQFVSGLLITVMVLVGRWKDVKYPTTASIPVWHDETYTTQEGDVETTFRDTIITLENVDINLNLRVAWTIVFFFWGSAVFEALAAYLIGFTEARPQRANKIYYMEQIYTLRFIEYSITASAMLVIIAAQVGVWDWRSLSSIAGLCATCMLCGIIGERASQTNTKDAVLAFVIGTIAFAFAWLPILWTYFRAMSSETPEFVTVIIIVEILLWISFAIVQLVQIYWKLKPETVLPWYLLLSIVSKWVLGWLIVSQVLANN